MARKPSTKGSAQKKAADKGLIVKALTNPAFRRMLTTNPAKALGKKRVTAKHKDEIRFVLATVKGIQGQINALADQLLCANGPCGIA